MEILVIVAVAVVVAAGLVVALRAARRGRARERPGVPGEPAAPAVAVEPPAEAATTGPAPARGTAVAEPGAAPAEAAPAEAAPAEAAPVTPPPARPRLRDRLGRTRAALGGFLEALRGHEVDDATWDGLEEALLLADVGVPTTQRLLDAVRERAKRDGVGDPDALVGILREEVAALLAESPDRELRCGPSAPNVWMFVGVNGVGKTTTIGKLAAQQVGAGRRVVLAAADTFRAAAADQLELWAQRTGAEIVRSHADGADPGSVVYDAMAAAASRGADLVLVDTAGRLHTKTNLMEELKKLRRIVDRNDGALQEVLLVIDATTGQNGLAQARQFADAVDVTGIALTKLDGTAKGGIVLAIQAELGIPVKVVGIGEGVEDLVPFDAEEFARALFED